MPGHPDATAPDLVQEVLMTCAAVLRAACKKLEAEAQAPDANPERLAKAASALMKAAREHAELAPPKSKEAAPHADAAAQRARIERAYAEKIEKARAEGFAAGRAEGLAAGRLAGGADPDRPRADLGADRAAGPAPA